MTTVTFTQEHEIGHIVLCDPPFNFVSAEYKRDLIAAVHEAGQSDMRALLIEAEGPNFSLGGAAHEWHGVTYQWFRTFVGEITASYRAIEALEVPVVAAVRGQVVGGGLELALSADFLVASDNAILWPGEAIAGQLPLAGGLQRLASTIGPVKTRQMVMLAEPTPVTTIPDVAVAIVADDALDETALELASRLAKGPTRAYAAVRAVLKAWSSGGISAADKLMADLTIHLFNTEDCRNAFDAAGDVYGALARGEQPRTSIEELGLTYLGR